MKFLRGFALRADRYIFPTNAAVFINVVRDSNLVSRCTCQIGKKFAVPIKDRQPTGTWTRANSDLSGKKFDAMPVYFYIKSVLHDFGFGRCP